MRANHLRQRPPERVGQVRHWRPDLIYQTMPNLGARVNHGVNVEVEHLLLQRDDLVDDERLRDPRERLHEESEPRARRPSRRLAHGIAPQSPPSGRSRPAPRARSPPRAVLRLVRLVGRRSAIATTCRALYCQVCLTSACSRAAAPTRWRSGRSVASDWMMRASSSALPGAYSQPVRPCSRISSTCPTRAATTGRAIAMYSNSFTGEK